MIRSVIFDLVLLQILSLNNFLVLCRPISLKNEPALLVISYDAFRPDYLNRNVTSHLNKFRKESTSAQYMLNVFPTKTFVNHFTIATGLYADTHGVLSNDLYDSKLGKYIKYSYELFHYNKDTIPIWTANEMAGKTSGCMMWPGSDFEYQGENCTFTGVFSFDSVWTDRVDTALSWFQDERTPANLVMLYFEDPDEHGHAFGPESEEVTKMLAKLDSLTGYIQEKLIKTGLDKRVNVIHVSDHGMNTVIPPNFIDLKNFVDKGSCEMFGTSPVSQIVPVKGKENEVFNKLTKAAKKNGHFKVYNQQNIPARWHANNTERLGPIFAVADIGYGFQDLWEYAEYFKKKYNIPITNESTYGVHGYDNAEPSMHAIFMAKGPLFNKGKTLESVNMIDLYNLFCLTLSIYCEPNHGSSDSDTWNELFAVRPIEAVQRKKGNEFHWILSAIILVALLLGVISFIRAKRNRMRNKLLRNTESSRVVLTEFETLDNETVGQRS